MRMSDVMALLDKIAKWGSDVGSTVASLIKTVLLSHRVSKPGEDKGGRTLVILGNGPSLRKVLEERPGWMRNTDRLAVNFAANTKAFASLRPEYYVLADPHFFHGEGKDSNVSRLWTNILACDWEMTLFVPVREYSAVRKRVADNPRIGVKTFNLTPAEGWPGIVHRLFDLGLAMPRPRNVMIPSIMIAMREGYRLILLAGADHSWLQTLFVDEENHVVSVQPHFYADNDKEKERVRGEYAGYHLHDILGSMVVAFRSYHQIAHYASRRGVEIINATPGSYIDAFPRI